MLKELEKDRLSKTAQYAQERLDGLESGHDWWHTHRVLQLTQHIAERENANIFICSMAALLHDVDDHKFASPGCSAAKFETRDFLQDLNMDVSVIDNILYIIENLSYSAGIDRVVERTVEFQVVQDADRLDAIGAIGIARAFNYGGYKNRPIYQPGVLPEDYATTQDYREGKSSTIMHFYEKLLKLKEAMNTNTAKGIAELRHNYLLGFLERFFQEWEEFTALH